MLRKSLLGLSLAAVLSLPFLVRDSRSAIDAAADDTVVILTGHNENLRYELGRGFREWYRRRTGRTVYVDWRFLGGVSEVIRYLDSVYTGAFRYHWEHDLHRPWTDEVQRIFVHRTADRSRWKTQLEREVCGSFYDSSISSGVDLFFGGGASEFVIQADLGTLVDCGLREEHPEWFCDEAIPHHFAGEELWDGQGRWFGQVFSTFGILINRDALAARGVDGDGIVQWEQLADPRLVGMVALADPSKSSALLKACESIIQQQMLFCLREMPREEGMAPEERERRGVAEGWMRGLRLLQRISANARYYADAPSKMILDVSSGNSAVGIIVDFMGQSQVDEDRRRCGHGRLRFVLPANGSAISADPIAMLRGAPNANVAKLFMEYVLGLDGQKVVSFAVGTPGGPVRSGLFRPAMRREIYSAEFDPYRLVSGNPYVDLADFDYHRERTIAVYAALKWAVKYSCIVPHGELVEAWRAILEAREEGRWEAAENALRVLEDFSGFAIGEISQTLEPILHQASPAKSLALQRKITRRFQEQYARARRMAEAKEDPTISLAR
ncbi:MAG: extracellular solute-binding protein [Puniceicoccales bacterium]|jgi:ABC-type Fe3+ transport system substrate-binding protein|nr:extracellular solute-binding protein [Puniceicoccales bacterium]